MVPSLQFHLFYLRPIVFVKNFFGGEKSIDRSGKADVDGELHQRLNDFLSGPADIERHIDV